jgi:hypothetical protein
MYFPFGWVFWFYDGHGSVLDSQNYIHPWVSACKQIDFSLQDHSSRFKLAYSGWDSPRRVALKVSLFQNILLVSSFGPKYQRNFSRISALASKKRSNQKSSVRGSK